VPNADRATSEEDEDDVVGEELDLIASDVGSKADVPAWCQRTGNELVSMKEENGIFTYRIKKLK
jgi:TusA-related sulfurtransferase